jgi:Uma2 family endonuclease
MSTQSVSVLSPVEAEEVESEARPLFLPKGIEAITVLPEEGKFTASDFAAFCAENPDLRIEMTSEGEMIIMLPVGPTGSNRNFILNGRFFAWAEKDPTGIGFDATAGFTLPNGAERSPDASWISLNRWEALTKEEQEIFSPICPDFVAELRSRTDRLRKLQKKMEEYIENGAQLGWLIDPKEKKVHVYRPGAPVEILDQPKEISGEPLLKGFTLNLEGIID